LQFESVFTSIIEVGIATAGFSGIVAALGRRSQGEWVVGDIGRISILLQASFSVILFSFLALTLVGAGISESAVWRISSASYTAYLAISVPVRVRQARKASDADPSIRLGSFLFVSVVGGVLIGGLQSYNVLVLHAGWQFVIAVLGELAQTFAMFARLLRGLWQRPAD
jgi:hypothetical protein